VGKFGATGLLHWNVHPIKPVVFHYTFWRLPNYI